MPKQRRGKKQRRNDFIQTSILDFVTEEPEPEPQVKSEAVAISPDLVARLTDLELRLKRLEGQKEFISTEPAKSTDQYIAARPEMVGVNVELKKLIASGRIKVAQ